MPGPRTSRFLAERVEIAFHRRGNRFRRITWLTGLAAALLCLGWLAWASSRDQHVIYAAGPVAKPHAFIEHDCQQCHAPWGVGQRLIAWDPRIRSVENESCVKCHDGPVHHANQVPDHDKLSCVMCHLEHRGSEAKLSDVANQFCVDCHADLKTTHGRSDTFVTNIRSFRSTEHPESALLRVLDRGPPANGKQPDSRHGAFSMLAELQRTNDPAPRWQDKAPIAFNHKRHLELKPGEVHLPLGCPPDKKFASPTLPLQCSNCHELDADRRYMRPIDYESHCRSCHPLLFDNQRFPCETVPHGQPDLIRGFLAERYTLRALQAAEAGQPTPLRPNPPRPKPGERVASQLNIDHAEQVRQLVADAERMVLEFTQTISGQSTRGGCRYCHVVTDPVGDKPFQVEKPRIPSRWLPHSVFDHDSHRFMTCIDCHVGVDKSASTGDVLIPSIRICLKCHSSDPAERDPSLRAAGARSNCVECHVYHHRDGKNK